jgi:hypothetical protein
MRYLITAIVMCLSMSASAYTLSRNSKSTLAFRCYEGNTFQVAITWGGHRPKGEYSFQSKVDYKDVVSIDSTEHGNTNYLISPEVFARSVLGSEKVKIKFGYRNWEKTTDTFNMTGTDAKIKKALDACNVTY